MGVTAWCFSMFCWPNCSSKTEVPPRQTERLAPSIPFFRRPARKNFLRAGSKLGLAISGAGAARRRLRLLSNVRGKGATFLIRAIERIAGQLSHCLINSIVHHPRSTLIGLLNPLVDRSPPPNSKSLPQPCHDEIRKGGSYPTTKPWPALPPPATVPNPISTNASRIYELRKQPNPRHKQSRKTNPITSSPHPAQTSESSTQVATNPAPATQAVSSSTAVWKTKPIRNPSRPNDTVTAAPRRCDP